MVTEFLFNDVSLNVISLPLLAKVINTRGVDKHTESNKAFTDKAGKWEGMAGV